MSTRDRLKQQIERYVTILRPKYEPKTGGTVDLQAMDKPSSTPPTSDAAVRLMTHPDNVKAARRLESILNDMAMNFAGNAPFIYVQCLAAAGWRETNPGLVTAWRAGDTDDAKILAQVFDEALDYVADIYVTRYGSEPLRVVISRHDEPCKSHREAQVIDTNYTDAIIVEKVEKIKREEGPMAAKAAWGILTDREGYSQPRIRKAIEKQNRRKKAELEDEEEAS